MCKETTYYDGDPDGGGVAVDRYEAHQVGAGTEIPGGEEKHQWHEEGVEIDAGQRGPDAIEVVVLRLESRDCPGQRRRGDDGAGHRERPPERDVHVGFVGDEVDEPFASLEVEKHALEAARNLGSVDIEKLRVVGYREPRQLRSRLLVGVEGTYNG